MDAGCSGTKRDGGDNRLGKIWFWMESSRKDINRLVNKIPEVPYNSSQPEIDIKSNELIIYSATSLASLDKQYWCKIVTRDFSSATVHNISLTNIIVDGVSLGNEEDLIIKCGSEIISGPEKAGHVVYTFKLMPMEQHLNKRIKVPFDIELVKCSICLNLLHDAVTVAPCLHNFCNGCFSEWMTRSLQKSQPLLCPYCRAKIYCGGRNHFLRNIEEVIQESDPSLKRSPEELTNLDSCATIKREFVTKLCRSRAYVEAASLATTNGSAYVQQCLQCAGSGFAGYRCSQSTVHRQCHGCGHMMPSRPEIGIPQHCVGCERLFCAAYWQAQGVSYDNASGLCNPGTFKPISDRVFTRMPESTHQGNTYEQGVTQRCIAQSGKTLHDVIMGWCLKFDNREISTISLACISQNSEPMGMMLNNIDSINSKTFLCDHCCNKVVAHLLYCFRLSIPKQDLPTDASIREDCWYGWACRTQHHNAEHARKRNHICSPIRRPDGHI